MRSFVSPALAAQAIELELPSIEKLLGEVANRQQLHIVVAVQATHGASFHPDVDTMRAPVYYYMVAEKSLGERSEWEYPFDEIAHGKVDLSARTGLDSRVVHLQRPELLEPGHVKWWGSVIKHGVIVGASGVQSYFDELVCRKILATLEALVEYQRDQQDGTKGSFFTA